MITGYTTGYTTGYNAENDDIYVSDKEVKINFT